MPAQTRRAVRWMLVGYVVLLAASTAVRWSLPDAEPGPDQTVQPLPAFDGGTRQASEQVLLAYRDVGADRDRPPVVLLHGSPVASSAMTGLERAFKRRGRRVLNPDLPGFGGSSIRIPDYSVRAHGAYLSALLDSLGIRRAHLVAYSMGGGVALEASGRSPDRIASVSLVSAIGVQELELTGDYHLNHAVHAAQLGALWLLRAFTPHFGYLDDAILGVPYARNFFDTDQRPLRGLLESLGAPALIIHGADDFLVPLAAAREHHRIVPQADLLVFPEGAGGHGLVFSRPDTVAAIVSQFLDRVDAGGGVTRDRASPARLEAAAVSLAPSDYPRPGAFSTIVLMVLVAIASFVSEDLATIGSGLMAARGTFTFLTAVLAALLGIVVGDVGLYVAGRWLGRPLVRRAPFRWWIKEADLERGARWFERRGLRAILVARFVPGTRAPTYVTAGVIKAPFWRFLGYFMVAALLWTPALVGLAMLLGQQVLAYYSAFEQYALWVLVGLVVLLLFAARVIPQLASHAGRRRLYGRWQRLTRWEFWPPWIFYPPLVLWCAWLAVRYRSATAFTAANPGIPEGGFLGESKSAILASMPHPAVARWTLLEAASAREDGATAQEQLADWKRSESLRYPVVLKPDVGERGAGVSIVQTTEEAARALAGGALLAQEYVPGVEFGVFYVRAPDQSRGQIISVTDKRFPAVTGNGRSTLQELILNDERAVCMSRLHERAHADRLQNVPKAGEEVRLVQLGTHCRGALFLNGEDVATESLARALDEIADTFPGFHFGRFDLRGPDRESFRRGEGFRVIELNGVTSESTHIYDPANSLTDAYRTLFRQWETAFRIGRANMRNGHRPAGVSALARLVIQRLRRRA